MACEGTEYEPGKLFVGGLSWETTKENLREHFSQFGEISDCTVMYNSENKHRGFGFVTFSTPAVADVALQYKGNPPEEGHFIDGKKVDPKKAIKSGQAPKVKLFLGGIPENTSVDDIRRVFSQYGHVTEEGVELKYDKESGKCRGFGFLTFESQRDAEKAILERYVEVNGKRVEVKKAENSSKPMGGRSGYPQGYGASRMYNGGYPAPAYSPHQQQQQQQQQGGAYGYSSGAGYPAAYPQWPGYSEQYAGGSTAGTGYYPQPQGSNPAPSYNGAAYGSAAGYNSSPRTDTTGAYASAVPQAQGGYNYQQQQQQPSQQLYSYGQSYSSRSQEQQGYNNGFSSRQ